MVIVWALLAVAVTLTTAVAWGASVPTAQAKLPPLRLQPAPVMALKSTPVGWVSVMVTPVMVTPVVLRTVMA